MAQKGTGIYYKIKEEIYSLYKEGKSNRDIQKILGDKGIHIEDGRISYFLKQVLCEKGEKHGYRNMSFLRKKTEVEEKRVFELHNIGMQFSEIAKLYELEFKSKGIEITVNSDLIRKRYEKYCKDNGEEDNIQFSRKSSIKAVEVFDLLKEGLSIEQIGKMKKDKSKKKEKLKNKKEPIESPKVDLMCDFKERIDARKALLEARGEKLRVFDGNSRRTFIGENQIKIKEIDF